MHDAIRKEGLVQCRPRVVCSLRCISTTDLQSEFRAKTIKLLGRHIAVDALETIHREGREPPLLVCDP